MKSTPINAMESITGLQPVEDRRDKRVLALEEKLKRFNSHLIHDRMYSLSRSRILRTSFVNHADTLRKDNPVLSKCKLKQIQVTDRNPPWKSQLPALRKTIPGILKKDKQDNSERKALTERYIGKEYP